MMSAYLSLNDLQKRYPELQNKVRLYRSGGNLGVRLPFFENNHDVSGSIAKARCGNQPPWTCDIYG
eukprot:314124-Amorphochlora_amoeboformis.AAC.3